MRVTLEYLKEVVVIIKLELRRVHACTSIICEYYYEAVAVCEQLYYNYYLLSRIVI